MNSREMVNQFQVNVLFLYLLETWEGGGMVEREH